MRKVFRACMLALALCAPVFAGDMPTPPATPPPPPQNVVQEPTTEGDMQFPKASEDALTEIMLSMLSGVLTLL